MGAPDSDSFSEKPASGDLRTILWFPAYDLAQLYCGAKVLDTGMDTIGDSWILLLAHERLRRN